MSWNNVGRPRMILLTGSPAPDSLSWSDDVLDDTLLPAFAEKRLPTGTQASGVVPAWRSVPLEQVHLPTGLTQASRDDEDDSFEHYRRSAWGLDGSFELGGESSLMTTEMAGKEEGEKGTAGGDEEDLTGYYEHSFILHDELPSSQIVEPVPSTAATTSFSASTEFYSFPSSDDSEPSSSTEEALHVLAKLQSTRICDLRDVPSAAHLRSINPQTVTVNLVVGVISAPPPRQIRTRRGGRMVDLVELLVGDESRSGLGINIWLPPAEGVDRDSRTRQPESQSSMLRDQVLRLRPQDVILVSRVALNSFRGTVYGQSLRKGMTSLDMLHQHHMQGAAGDRSRMTGGGCALQHVDWREGTSEQFAKVRRTQEWVLRFVAGPPRGESERRPGQRLPSLPPDTPTSAPDLI